MSRDELVELVALIMKGAGTDEEDEENLRRFIAAVPHPSPTDFLADTERDWSAEEIVDACLGYKAIALGSGAAGAAEDPSE